MSAFGALEHKPVLLQEAVEALVGSRDGVYVDATFGRGGHSFAILERLGVNGRLLALDRDPVAVEIGAFWCDPRFSVECARFSSLKNVLEKYSVGLVDGVLLDLGVSSPQLEDPGRGFSFRLDGPLDMRMDPRQGFSAREWLFSATEDDIAKVLKNYGEERFAVSIAKAIIARRGSFEGPELRTTKQLAALVSSVIKRKRSSMGTKDPATRTFQAIRILVNQELEELTIVLDAILDVLKIAGRLVVLSFHSLEDRIVKHFIARKAGKYADRDCVTGAVIPGNVCLRSAGRFFASKEERILNPRSRSVVMRVAERVSFES